MGRPRKVADEPVEVLMTDIEEPEDKDVETILSQVGDNAKVVIIHRQNERLPGKYDYLVRTEAGEFSLEYIKQEYGGGNYRGKIYGKDGLYIKHFSFSIDSRFKPPVKETKVISLTPEPNSELSEIKALIQGQNEIMRLMIEQNKPSQSDPLQMMVQMATIFTGLNKPKQDVGFEQMFSVLKEGIKMGQVSEGGDSYLPVLEGLGKPLIELLSKQNEQAENVLSKVNGNIPLTPNPATKTNPIKEKINERMQVNNINDYIKVYIPQFLNLSSKGKDPILYAALMLDQLPDKFVDDLAEFVHGENTFEKLLILNPDVKNHESWFQSFILQLKENLILEPEETETIKEEPKTGKVIDLVPGTTK